MKQDRVRRLLGSASVVLGAGALTALLVGCGASVAKLAENGDVAGLVEVAEKPDQDYTRVCDAVDALGELGTEEAVDVLIGWVAGNDDSLRTAAIPALGVTGDPDGVEPLVAEINGLDSTDISFYEMELRALVIALGGIDDPRAAKELLRQADAKNGAVVGPTYLGEALAGQGDDIAGDVRSRLVGKSADVYAPCGVALYELNADDKKSISSLLREKATQRVWVGVFAAGEAYGFKDDLVFALEKFGDVGLAREMLNSGDEKMERFARSWAGKHGYMIQQITEYGMPQ